LDQTVAEEARPAVAVPRRGLVLMAALMAIFMPAVESSIVATALPTIIGHLGGFHLFSWVFAVPLLTMAVTIPLYGRLADIYGRRRVFFAGTAIFLTGTTLCGFARCGDKRFEISPKRTGVTHNGSGSITGDSSKECHPQAPPFGCSRATPAAASGTRITPHDRAGTGHCRAGRRARGGSYVTVTYVLTALTTPPTRRAAGCNKLLAGFGRRDRAVPRRVTRW